MSHEDARDLAQTTEIAHGRDDGNHEGTLTRVVRFRELRGKRTGRGTETAGGPRRAAEDGPRFTVEVSVHADDGALLDLRGEHRGPADREVR